MLACVLVCLLVVWPAVADHGQQQKNDPHRKARIVFTSEMPRIAETEQGDYAELATLLKQYRREPQPLFFLFGGDSLGPSTLSSFDRGAHIIDLLNLLEPDAMGVAKREFSFYEDELSQRSYEASFPLVASNLFDPITGANLDGLESSVLVQQGQVKIGVIAVLSPAAQQQYPLKRVMIFDPQTAVREQSALLRRAGAELVVLLYLTLKPQCGNSLRYYVAQVLSWLCCCIPPILSLLNHCCSSRWWIWLCVKMNCSGSPAR